jgi:hypothetical protein
MPITQKPLAAWDAAGAFPAENVDAADAAFPVPLAVWYRLDHLWIQAVCYKRTSTALSLLLPTLWPVFVRRLALRRLLSVTCCTASSRATYQSRPWTQRQVRAECFPNWSSTAFFALSRIICLAALVLAGLLPASSVTDISALHSSSIQALAPDAVALVDAFDHDDFTLDSAVGTSI